MDLDGVAVDDRGSADEVATRPGRSADISRSSFEIFVRSRMLCSISSSLKEASTPLCSGIGSALSSGKVDLLGLASISEPHATTETAGSVRMSRFCRKGYTFSPFVGAATIASLERTWT